jgi:hypothetical protein
MQAGSVVQATTPQSGPGATAAVNLRRFYEAQPYQCSGTELACLIEGRQAVVGDPERWFHLYFPDQPYREGLQALVVGCPNSEAARLAAGAAQTRFLAIDQDDTALDQLDRLKQHYRLENLELMWLGSDQIPVIDRRFDLVFCPQGPPPPLPAEEFLRLVRSRLTESGSLVLTVGGRHGRLGVRLLRRFIEAAGLDVDTADATEIRSWAAALPASHPFRAAVADLPELSSDSGLLDAVRSGEPAFSVPELQALLEQSGLRLQRFLCQAPYMPECGGLASVTNLAFGPDATGINVGNGMGDDLGSGGAAHRGVADEPRWFALAELFRGNLRSHIAVACRDDRPASSYAVSFHGRDWLEYKPVRNPGLEIEAGHFPSDGVARLSWAAHENSAISLVVSEKQARLFDLMDGDRSIAAIVEAADLRGVDSEELARGFFQALWRRDYAWFQIPASSGGYFPLENPL